MVEASIGGIVVFILIFLVFQATFLMRAYVSAQDAASEGARSGAVGANQRAADYDILEAVRRGLSNSSRANLVKVVVFKPEGTDGAIPSGCLTSSRLGECNVYAPADLDRPSTDFTGSTWDGDQSWAPQARSASRDTSIDKLGVYVEVNSWPVGGFPNTVISKSSIVRLEPQS